MKTKELIAALTTVVKLLKKSRRYNLSFVKIKFNADWITVSGTDGENFVSFSIKNGWFSKYFKMLIFTISDVESLITSLQETNLVSILVDGSMLFLEPKDGPVIPYDSINTVCAELEIEHIQSKRPLAFVKFCALYESIRFAYSCSSLTGSRGYDGVRVRVNSEGITVSGQDGRYRVSESKPPAYLGKPVAEGNTDLFIPKSAVDIILSAPFLSTDTITLWRDNNNKFCSIDNSGSLQISFVAPESCDGFTEYENKLFPEYCGELNTVKIEPLMRNLKRIIKIARCGENNTIRVQFYRSINVMEITPIVPGAANYPLFSVPATVTNGVAFSINCQFLIDVLKTLPNHWSVDFGSNGDETPVFISIDNRPQRAAIMTLTAPQ